MSEWRHGLHNKTGSVFRMLLLLLLLCGYIVLARDSLWLPYRRDGVGLIQQQAIQAAQQQGPLKAIFGHADVVSKHSRAGCTQCHRHAATHMAVAGAHEQSACMLARRQLLQQCSAEVHSQSDTHLVLRHAAPFVPSF